MKFFFLILICTSSMLLSAQELLRKAYLGAQIEKVDNGFMITHILGGTAMNLKLEKHDVILEINGIKLKDQAALSRAMNDKRSGDAINLTIQRNKKTLNLKGVFQSKPLETSDFSEVIYDAAPYKDGQLRVIINKPFGAKDKSPAMLFIPGYTCSSIDNLSSNHPYKRIIDAYIKAGFVTLRIEKSGLGDSSNTPPCESCDLRDEINNFQVGLDKLQSLSYVDTNQIFIVGHSMGGIIAPAISAANRVAGVVVYGTTAKSWFEYQIELARVQNKLAGLNPLDHEQSVRDQYELNYRYFVKKEPLSDIAKDSVSLLSLINHFQYDAAKGMIYGRNAEYWRQIQDINHLENWKKTEAQVLVQFGESDFQAFSRNDHEQIVETCNYYKPGSATLKVYPSTDHYYAKSGTMQEAFDKFMQQKYRQLFDEYNPEVGNDAVNWSLDVILKLKGQEQSKPIWNKLDTEPYPGKQDDIYFVNESVGWYINGYGKLYKTVDGGSTWSKIYENKGSFFRTIAFVDENIGFLGTVGTDYFPNVRDTIPLYHTKDGGHTWQPVEYTGPYVKGLCAIDIVKEAFINHGVTDYKIHIFAVGRVGSPAHIVSSHDGGKTWKSKSMNEDCKMLFDIKMFDKNIGIACAASDEDISKSNALILRTTDGGNTWKKVYQSTRPFETTWKVSFPTADVGYVTIQSYNPDPNVKQQRIAKTTDGGVTWAEIPLVNDHSARQFGIGFITEDLGYVGTMNSGYETQDGGRTWQAIDLGRACNKIRIYKSQNKTFGYAIGVDVFQLNDN